MFKISSINLQRNELVASLSDDRAGAIVVFEGWVRDHNEGKKVKSLEYQVYHELALKEGQKILDEAKAKFNIHDVHCVHREGHLKLGEIAVWIGVTSSHRDDAYKASRFVIDEIKHRLPVWKKEHYIDQTPEWVFCRHHHHHVHFEESEYYQKQAKIVDQAKLKKARVLVVGAGGLGCPVLVNLASAGVGHITIVDPDSISISNIHRQTLFSPNLVGEKKAIVAANRIMELNPFIQVQSIVSRAKIEHFDNHDLIIDCTDNMDTKYFIHDVCHKLRIPFVSASVYQSEGQVRTFIPGEGCLRCHSHMTPDDGLLGNCNDFGVLGVTTSVLGSIQASEAIQFISSGRNTTQAHTLFINLKDLSQMKIKNSKNADCKVCAGVVDLMENDLEVDGGMEILDIRNLTDEEIHLMKPHKVALCCHRGVRSKKLALELRSKGQEVYSLKGGACSL